MTPQNVRNLLADLEKLAVPANDPEEAHRFECEIHRQVLQSIADDSCTSPRTCAKLALTSRDIEFPRWFA